MEFLNELGFNQEEIKEIQNRLPKLIQEKVEKYSDTVSENIVFLKDFGVTNWKEVVTNYIEMLLMGIVNFQKIFLKYDKEDLIEKIAKNVAVIEFL